MRKRITQAIIIRAAVVLWFATVGHAVHCQVISRTARMKKAPVVVLEEWPEGLSQAWQRVWPPHEDELDMVPALRSRIVRELAEAGLGGQAMAAAGWLGQATRYDAFARLGSQLKDGQAADAIEEAQRGFQFLSGRSQEQLAAQMMGIAVPRGQAAVREMLGRCPGKEERIVALGKAAFFAAAVSPTIFAECVAELTDGTVQRSPLEKRYTALALQEAAEGLRCAGKDDWRDLCAKAGQVLSDCPLNTADVFAALAGTCFAGGEEETGKELLSHAQSHWQRLGAATPERMRAMVAITEAVVESGNDHLEKDWNRQALQAARTAEEDWRWELWIQAGRICRLNGEPKEAVQAWGEALKAAEANSNAMVKPACEGLIAIEAHEAGIKWADAVARERQLPVNGGENGEDTSGQ